MNAVRRYTKKPVTIEAIHLNRREFFDALDWLACNGVVSGYSEPEGYIRINTLEGVMTATCGDYIIKGVKGEFYPCKPDIFELTYEEAQNHV